MHPSIEDLIDYAERGESDHIRDHLSRCAECTDVVLDYIEFVDYVDVSRGGWLWLLASAVPRGDRR